MGFFSKDIKTMNDLFMHGLQDLYYAENQIAKSLPDMIEKATNPQLRVEMRVGNVRGCGLYQQGIAVGLALRDDVVRACGGKRHDHAHGLGGIGLRPGAPCGAQHAGGECGEHSGCFHAIPPLSLVVLRRQHTCMS